MLTKEQATAKELIDSGWIIAVIKEQLATQLEERPHKRGFIISINNVERLPTKEAVLSTRKFIEEWLLQYQWVITHYAYTQYGLLAVEIE